MGGISFAKVVINSLVRHFNTKRSTFLLNSFPQFIDFLKKGIEEAMSFLFGSAADQGGFFGEITQGGFNLVAKQGLFSNQEIDHVIG
jgi:hypothetical protein